MSSEGTSYGYSKNVIKERTHPYVVAVIPAFNESENITDLVSETVKKVNFVIVIDDGSVDDTASKAGIFANTKVLRNRRNLGKGTSLRRGFEEAIKHDPDIIVTLDGDGQHDPSDIPNVIRAIDESNADLVIGSRYAEGSVNEVPRVRDFGLLIINKMNRVLTRSALGDSQSGFRAFNRNAMQLVLESSAEGYGTEAEQVARAESYGYNVVEVPIHVKYRGLAKTSKRNFIVEGADISSTILKIAIERRPLAYFGISGAVLLAIALVTATEILILFNESRYFSIPLALITSGFAVSGLLLILISFVLHVMKRIRILLLRSNHKMGTNSDRNQSVRA